MNIVHIHEIDGYANGTGAHIVMNQLHQGLKQAGIDSKIIYARTSDGFDDAYPISRPVLIKIIERVLGWWGRLGSGPNRARLYAGVGEW